jgi:hypothetical protein
MVVTEVVIPKIRGIVRRRKLGSIFSHCHIHVLLLQTQNGNEIMVYYRVNFSISIPLSILCEKRDLRNCIHTQFAYDFSFYTLVSILYPVEVFRIFATIGFMKLTYKTSEYEFMELCIPAE